MNERLMRQHRWYLLFGITSVLLFRVPLTNLVRLAWQDERYSHIIFLPVISLALIAFHRKRIFANVQYCPQIGIPILMAGVTLFALVKTRTLSQGDDGSLSLLVLAIVLTWTAGFAFFYGVQSLKAAFFPLALLLLIVPLPTAFLEGVAVALQKGSAEVTYLLFKLTGTPVYRQGLVFSLPGLDIEVAKECSGIRSTTALIIAALVASHLFLRFTWSRACFVILAIPVAIFKNALRITILSWLGVHVSRDFLQGWLHHHGGPLFAVIAFAIMLPLAIALRRLEKNRHRGEAQPPHVVAAPEGTEIAG
jgi:exosortase